MTTTPTDDFDLDALVPVAIIERSDWKYRVRPFGRFKTWHLWETQAPERSVAQADAYNWQEF